MGQVESCNEDTESGYVVFSSSKSLPHLFEIPLSNLNPNAMLELFGLSENICEPKVDGWP